MGMAMTVVSFSMVSYHGQRAFESWRAGQPPAIVEMAEQTGARAEGFFQQMTDMAAAARDFYELQIASEDADEAEEGR